MTIAPHETNGVAASTSNSALLPWHAETLHFCSPDRSEENNGGQI